MKILVEITKLSWRKEGDPMMEFDDTCIYEMGKSDARQNCENEIWIFQSADSVNAYC